MAIKITATILRIHNSKICILFIIFPNFETLFTKIIEKIITGSPVANANTAGIIKPSPAFNARGISIPKNNTALNGQNAKAKITPKRNAPKNPFFANPSFNPFNQLFDLRKCNFNKSNITIPIMSNNGPRIFSPYFCKNNAIVCVCKPNQTIKEARPT